MIMVEYKDRHGKPIKEGLYTTGNGDYFRIRNTSTSGLMVVSSLNTGFYVSLEQQLTSKLTPLLAAKMEVESLRDTANWLEKQLEEIEGEKKIA